MSIGRTQAESHYISLMGMDSPVNAVREAALTDSSLDVDDSEKNVLITFTLLYNLLLFGRTETMCSVLGNPAHLGFFRNQ